MGNGKIFIKRVVPFGEAYEELFGQSERMSSLLLKLKADCVFYHSATGNADYKGQELQIFYARAHEIGEELTGREEYNPARWNPRGDGEGVFAKNAAEAIRKAYEKAYYLPHGSLANSAVASIFGLLVWHGCLKSSQVPASFADYPPEYQGMLKRSLSAISRHSAYVIEERILNEPTKPYPDPLTPSYDVGPFDRMAIICPQGNEEFVWEIADAYAGISKTYAVGVDEGNGWLTLPVRSPLWLKDDGPEVIKKLIWGRRDSMYRQPDLRPEDVVLEDGILSSKQDVAEWKSKADSGRRR